MLRKFTEVPLDSESSMKDHENEFEKFYFISMVSPPHSIHHIESPFATSTLPIR